MKRILIFLVAVVLSLEVLKIYLQGQLFEDSINIEEIDKQIGQLRLVNSNLQVEILQKSALTTIEQEAKKQGFIPASYLYLP